MSRFWYQNLDERPGDEYNATGHIWKHGRAQLTFGNRSNLHWSWNFGSSFCMAELSCAQEDGFTLHLGLPPFAIWVGLYLSPLIRWYSKHDWKRFGVSIHGGMLWVNLWADDSCWSPGKHFWHPHRRRFNWSPLDTIFGRIVYGEERVLDTTDIVIAMPEGNYCGVAVRKVETWKRQRWPWWPSALRKVRTHVDMKDPIPFPGKGENSWDCGEDALHGQTSAAETVPQAIASIVESVLTSRKKYGGPRWVPEAVKQKEAQSEPSA